MSDSPGPTLLADVAPPTGLLNTLLTMSLTAIAVLRPLYQAETDVIHDFAWVHLNPAGQQMLQQPECPAASLLTLFPTAKADGVFDKCCQAFLTGELQRNQTYYQADGLDGYFLLVAQRYENLLVVNFTDTSAQPRTAAEEALRESRTREQAARAEAEQQRQRFLEVLTQMPAYIAVYQGPDHIYQFVNPAYQSLFPHRSFLGRPFREGTPEAEGLGVVALFDQVYQTGEPVYLREIEGWFDFHGNGQPVQVFLNISLHPLRNVQGHINSVLDFTYDVSEQVRARQQGEQLSHKLEARVQKRTRQLSEQQALLKQILGQVPAAIATTSGPEHRFTFFNQLYQKLVGQRAELGQSVANTLPEVIGQGHLAILDQVYATGQPYEGREVPFQLHDLASDDQPVHYVNFVYQPLANKKGQSTGILVFALDVTEQVLARRLVEESQQQVHMLNEELATINEELRATNEELGDSNTRLLRTNADLDTFVYTASHDLKAPIANIEGLLDVLSEYLPTGDQEPMVPELMNRMRGAIARFQQTVGHLTDVSHLQYQAGPAKEEVDIARVIEGVRLDLLSLLESTQAQLQLEVQECPPIHFALKDIRSIVYNLLSNGVKYRAPDRPPVVRIRAYCEAQQLVLEVQDNGLGLDRQQQGKLFTMFKRLHNHVEGSGVGLYMIKRLVENAGGTITVQSELGVGSTFIVVLPHA